MLQNGLLNGNGVDHNQIGGKDIKVPKYTLHRKSTDETFDVDMKFDDLAQLLEDEDLERVLVPPNFSSTGMRSNISKAGSEWRDLLGRIKKGSGKGNTIKT